MAWIRIAKGSEAGDDLRNVYQQVVVSSADRCPYCIQHHSAALSRYWEDEDKLALFIDNYRAIDLSPKMEAVLDYAFKLTPPQHAMAEADIRRLRDCGLPEDDILTMNLTASCFNFVNRVAIGLGVAFTTDKVEGYKY